MAARRFFAPVIPAVGESVQLSSDESRHALKVLRLQAGDKLQLLNGTGVLAEAEMLSASGKQVVSRILSRETQSHAIPRWHLYVAPPRGKNFESLLRVAVELGVYRIVPILCRFAVSRPEQVGENWSATMVAAAKQAINPLLPELLPPQEFSVALGSAPALAFVGAPANAGQNSQSQATFSAARDIAVWVGPEGGFADFELQALAAAGAQSITIGRYVLRVETAVPALLAYLRALQNILGGW